MMIVPGSGFLVGPTLASDPHRGNVVLAMHMDGVDPHWNNVVLAMHMDGTNDGTVFTDMKGKTVSRFGNTATKTGVKKYGTASAYFDGNGDYLTVPNSADFDFGSDDFTIECWVYLDKTPTSYAGIPKATIVSKDSATLGRAFQFNVHSANGTAWSALHLQVITNTGDQSITLSFPFSLNTFYYVVAAVKSNTVYLFVNGGLIGTGTFTGVVNTTSGPIFIGKNGYDNVYNFFFPGYIDDLRITKGVARYTANFTPPHHQFPDPVFFYDETGKTVTPYGNAAITTAQSPFSGGASAWLPDGNTGTIEIPSNSDFALGVGSPDFTVEAWLYPTTTAGAVSNTTIAVYIGNAYTSWTGSQVFMRIGAVTYSSVNYLEAVVFSQSDSARLTFWIPVVFSNWYHVAVVRDGNNLRVFVNGVLAQTQVIVDQLSQLAAPKVRILSTDHGSYSSTSEPHAWKGYIDDLRITKGVARYTSNFTPPSEPFTNS